MHKIFAKPLFLGKKIVFLPECHSTNDEMAKRIKQGKEPEGFLIYTDHQTNGKGQRGNIWLDEAGKNLLVSLLLRPKKLSISHQHYLNLIVGLALNETLEKFLGERGKLKWPNDIYVDERKIAGILIENNLRGSTIETSVVGVGCNINQQGFGINNATSLFIESEKEYERSIVLEDFLLVLERWYLLLNSQRFDEISKAYHGDLMWINEWHEFKASDGIFEGMIEGIDIHGKLVVKTRTGLKSFNIKEVEFIQ